MRSIVQDFDRDGYVIIESTRLRSLVTKLRFKFESEFKSRFGNEGQTNINLVKRFADSPELHAIFTSPEMIDAIKTLGIEIPVFCGPLVSHYTHGDLTGSSFGLSWHQDYPSMGSSSRAIIVWMSINDCNGETHSIEVAPGRHSEGLLDGEQSENGYVLTEPFLSGTKVLKMKSGDILLFSPFLPHRTYINSDSKIYKLSFSRRFDDLNCPKWPKRKYANAYGTIVDRDLYLKK